MGAYAFIFNADHESLGSNYGYPIINQTTFLLFKSDVKRTVSSCMQLGDIFLPSLSSKISEIKNSKSGHSHQSTYKFDKEMHMSLAVRFVEEIGLQWSTIDTKKILKGLLRKNTFCITFPTLDKDIAIGIDEELKANPAYYGVLEIDLGNKIQYYIVLSSLPEYCFIKNGIVYFEEQEGTGNNSFSLDDFNEKCPDSIVVIPTEDYKLNIPNVPECKDLSSSGEESLKIFEAKSKLTEYQKVLEMLRFYKGGVDLNLQAPLSENIHTFILDERKFVEYLLNDEHCEGGSKAKFFNEHLNIYKDDWRFLLAQFYYGIRQNTYQKLSSIDKHGVRYETYLPVIGRNNAVKSIKVCWIIQKDKIKLTSAMPDNNKEADLTKAFKPPIADRSLPANEKWQKIYNMASDISDIAMSTCIPTPMIVEQDIILDGMCGGAYVHLPDARSSFAKWLKKNELGENDYKTGLNIYLKNSNTQSHDKEKAGADAFAEVLILNGIDCIVRDYLT